MRYRYCARILVEATTPLKIGTGAAGLITDELVSTDANGLPIIPGTALAGVLRHAFKEKEEEKEKVKNIFGFQENKKGMGSRLIFSNAHFVGKDGQVIDGLANIDFSDDYYRRFKTLPIRDHTKINHKGVADREGHAKFDEQIVYKGCRFVFDMELQSNEPDNDNWSDIMQKIKSPLFRIGGGTRKGFGELKIVGMEQSVFDLTKDAKQYLARSARLNVPQNNTTLDEKNNINLIKYELHLKADDFFIFSSGYGDTEADAVAKKEPYIEWENDKPHFSEEKILIPASSVKGALAHRTAFHYNRLAGNFADQISVDEHENYVGENNEAVRELFGFAKNSEKGIRYGLRGRVIFSDMFISNAGEKIFDHVAIDRFTGGAIDGALFNEKVNYSDEEIKMQIVVEDFQSNQKEKIIEAFEFALKDIATGMLPLGGNVMRGHGCFSGKVLKNGEEI